MSENLSAVPSANSPAPDLPGKMGGDTTIVQNFDGLREKIKVTLNKDGTPRKPYTRRSGSVPSEPRPQSGADVAASPGFTEKQIKATFQGFHSMVALGTDCNVWFLSDAEADCFVPSATVALNQAFPGVAQSKWGSLTLAALAYSAVLISKALIYADYKRSLNAKKQETEPSANGSST